MFRKPRSARTLVLGAYTALALAASAIAFTGSAEGADTGDRFSAPRPVTVETRCSDGTGRSRHAAGGARTIPSSPRGQIGGMLERKQVPYDEWRRLDLSECRRAA